MYFSYNACPRSPLDPQLEHVVSLRVPESRMVGMCPSVATPVQVLLSAAFLLGAEVETHVQSAFCNSTKNLSMWSGKTLELVDI